MLPSLNLMDSATWRQPDTSPSSDIADMLPRVVGLHFFVVAQISQARGLGCRELSAHVVNTTIATTTLSKCSALNCML